jgi:hypothetical protein
MKEFAHKLLIKPTSELQRKCLPQTIQVNLEFLPKYPSQKEETIDQV